MILQTIGPKPSHFWLELSLKCFLCTILLFCLLGCHGRQLHLTLQAQKAINQDRYQHSLPVVLRVYQLKDKSRFSQSDFFTLWKDDHRALGPDLLAVDELTVSPGMHVSTQLSREDNAQYLAVMGLFQRPHPVYWRAWQFLPSWLSVFPQYARVHIVDNQLKLSG